MKNKQYTNVQGEDWAQLSPYLTYIIAQCDANHLL